MRIHELKELWSFIAKQHSSIEENKRYRFFGDDRCMKYESRVWKCISISCATTEKGILAQNYLRYEHNEPQQRTKEVISV